METALLQYPIDKVLMRLQKILKKRGYVIISSNQLSGKIIAQKRRFFRKRILLDIDATKLDEQATRVDLFINKTETPVIFNSDVIDKKLLFAKNKEQKLWNCIYDNF